MCMAQINSRENTMDCIFANNNALVSGGAIYTDVRAVLQSEACENMLRNPLLLVLHAFM